ncbi:hypothetical protein RD792_017458 [Penstemon davidsonii]|uniref:Pentatricopeptide repeat-containing protein n=1 Tax=Penstemon davidsonii TaxID=160366 RepID=A0ABR0CNW0_9LAMI|nr:hypothetical protein RD792_017458 [Penstemon davidsonii]
MEKAGKIFHSVVESGLKPSIITCNSLIDGYCKRGNVDEAWKLFIEVPCKGLEHTLVIYNSMLHGLFCAGRIDAGWKLFHEMELKVSSMISNALYFLVLDCDHYCIDPISARQTMCFYLDPKVSDTLFAMLAFILLSSLLKHVQEIFSYGDARLYMNNGFWLLMKSASCYFCATLNATLD